MEAWDAYVEQAKAFVNTGKLDSEEIDYKIEVGRKLAEARKAVLNSSEDWAALVKSGFSSNLTPWQQSDNLSKWCVGNPVEALWAMETVWADNASSISERISAFSKLYPRTVTSGAGTRMNVISVLLMGFDVQKYPPFRVTAFHQAFERTGYDQPPQDADEAALYEHAIGFLDRFIEEAAQRGLKLRHRLDAQSVVWAIRNVSDPVEPPLESEDLDDDELLALEPDLPALAIDLNLPVEFLENIKICWRTRSRSSFRGRQARGRHS